MPSNTRGNVVPADTIVNLSVDYNLEIGEIYNLQCVGGSSGLLYFAERETALGPPDITTLDRGVLPQFDPPVGLKVAPNFSFYCWANSAVEISISQRS